MHLPQKMTVFFILLEIIELGLINNGMLE